MHFLSNVCILVKDTSEFILQTHWKVLISKLLYLEKCEKADDFKNGSNLIQILKTMQIIRYI